jgi:hypothetical protein
LIAIGFGFVYRFSFSSSAALPLLSRTYCCTGPFTVYWVTGGWTRWGLSRAGFSKSKPIFGKTKHLLELCLGFLV